MVGWAQDGVNGGPSSMDVLLDWITTEGNYQRWKGDKKSSGISKESLCGLINGRLIDAGITHRKNNKIRERIGGLEAMFKAAEDWKANTGQGVTDEGAIRAEHAKRYPYYDQLLPIMGDRASSRVLFLSDILRAEQGAAPDELASAAPAAATTHGPARKKRKAVEEEWDEVRQQVLEAKERKSAKRQKIEEDKMELTRKRDAREERLTTLNVATLTEQAREASIKAKLQLLLARKQLKDAGVSDDIINQELPLD